MTRIGFSIREESGMCDLDELDRVMWIISDETVMCLFVIYSCCENANEVCVESSIKNVQSASRVCLDGRSSTEPTLNPAKNAARRLSGRWSSI